MAQTASGSVAASTSSNMGTTIQEFPVRVSKNLDKSYHVMRFNSSLGVDFSKWPQAGGVRMERENNMRTFKLETGQDAMPKSGAGSEFGREQKDEARRKKLGIISRRYNVEKQPWLLRVGGKNGKRFKGVQESGVGDNSSYYVFMQGADSAFEAYPISEWHDFRPVQTYKSLNAEEAEEEFAKRDKALNLFNIMLKKRLKNEDINDDDLDDDGPAKGKRGPKGKKSSDFKISDMDEWVHSSDEEDGHSGSDDEKESKTKAKKKKGAPAKKPKKKRNSDSEAGEDDSDDGDEEGREVDYMSDESSSEDDLIEEAGKAKESKENIKGVEDEEAIRAMEREDDSESGDEDKDKEKERDEEEGTKGKKGKGKEKKKKEGKDGKKKKSSKDSSSDTSSDSSDSDIDEKHSSLFIASKVKADPDVKESLSKGTKRGFTEALLAPALKKIKMDSEAANMPTAQATGLFASSSASALASAEGISDDTIRRYLSRKPMTAAELLQKFKNKKTGLNADQMVNAIAQALKRLNPKKEKIKDKLYLSMKN